MTEILVVDDNKDTVDLITTILEQYGFKVTRAYNGEEALKKISKKIPDLISLDIMMPGLSGWDVYERIKKDYDHDTKVIFLSALEISNQRKKQLEKEGVKDYIVKPFTSEQLIKNIQIALKN
ncbi:MAG TPA: response regulator [Bacteroidia bacterium]|nr:response regulator [Bacteroidia bacterium]